MRCWGRLPGPRGCGRHGQDGWHARTFLATGPSQRGRSGLSGVIRAPPDRSSAEHGSIPAAMMLAGGPSPDAGMNSDRLPGPAVRNDRCRLLAWFTAGVPSRVTKKT